MADIKTAEFKRASQKAVNDPQIQRALDKPFAHFVDGRAEAIESEASAIQAGLGSPASAASRRGVNASSGSIPQTARRCPRVRIVRFGIRATRRRVGS